MDGFKKLHIESCSLEVIGDDTYSYRLDRLEVSADFDVEQWEFSDGRIGQAIQQTRLFFRLNWSYFEGAIGQPAIGHMAMVEKFLTLNEVNLIPDTEQAAEKFKVLLNFEELKRIGSVNKGTIRRAAQLPLMTEDRLDSSKLQFFNFI